MKNLRCASCRVGRLRKTRAVDHLTIASHTFSARLPALRCASCGEHFFDAQGLARFELRIAVSLARSGVASGEAMRFLRKVAGMRAADLAELLDVTPETVSRWENGKQALDRRALAVLAALVIDQSEGRAVVLDALRAFRYPTRLARRVEFSARELSS